MTLHADNEIELARLTVGKIAYSITEGDATNAGRLLHAWDLDSGTRPICLAEVSVAPGSGAEMTSLAPGSIPLEVLRQLIASVDETPGA